MVALYLSLGPVYNKTRRKPGPRFDYWLSREFIYIYMNLKLIFTVTVCALTKNVFALLGLFTRQLCVSDQHDKLY